MIGTGSSGGTPTSGGTAGSVLFIGSAGVAQDNSNFFWDVNNHRLGLLTAVPTHSLTLASISTGIALYNTSDQTTNYERIVLDWNANVFEIIPYRGGTGSSRSLKIGSADSNGSTASGAFLTINKSSSPVYAFAGNSLAVASVVSMIHTLNASSGMQMEVSISPTITQTGAAGYNGLLVNPTESSIGSGIRRIADFQLGGTTMFAFESSGNFVVNKTITPAGTTGARTINKAAGTVNFDIGATSLVVTNSLVTASSIILPIMRTNDATFTVKCIVAGAGSFTIFGTTAATAETSVGFLVLN